MILIGHLAVLKNTMYKRYFPDLNTEAVLNSVQFSKPQIATNTIRGVRSRGSFGKYIGARKPFELTFTITCSPEVADRCFLSVLFDLQNTSGGYICQKINSFSESGFIPISISAANWSVQGFSPAQYAVTYQYFHLDSTVADAQPLVSSIFDFTDSEVEINLEKATKRPIESLSFSITGQYEVLRTLDGYYGIRYDSFNLAQTVGYFDDTFEYTMPYEAYVDPNSVTEGITTSTSLEGKRVYTRSSQGLLIPSDNTTIISTLPFGG